MKNLEEKIYSLMRKSKNMREVYRKNPNLDNENLLKELEAQSDIEDRIEKEPILKESLEGFSIIFGLKPSDILELIEFKSNTDIRMEFEKMKIDGGVNSGKKEFGADKGGYFKSGISGNDKGGDFSVNSNDLSF